MIETVGKTIIDIAEKTKEIREYIPSFLQVDNIPKPGTVDINSPVTRTNSDGLTTYQERLLKEGYGVPEEEIKKYSDWESIEKIQFVERPQVPPGESNELVNPFLKSEENTPNVFDKDFGKMSNSMDVSNEPCEHRTPENNGHWEGERGNSKWVPDKDYVPPEKSISPDKPYSNPDNLTWGEILEKYGIDGIPFKDGYPDFSEISRGTVEIEGFETGGNAEKNRNFNKAYIALAEQRGCSPDEVKQWMKDNNYTWHECEDKKTMQKVPNEVHANVPHDGGRSQHD